jgi:hypothetical protein
VVRPVPSGSSPRIFIGKMSDAELYQIAGDKDETIRRRNMLETELGSLKAGEKILESRASRSGARNSLMSVPGIELEQMVHFDRGGWFVVLLWEEIRTHDLCAGTLHGAG